MVLCPSMFVRVNSAWLKYAIGLGLVFAFRLLPFRPPNVEPMLAVMMPFSTRFGSFGAFLFGFLGIVLYDAATSGWGSWTWVTALAYGALGIGAYYYFSYKAPSRLNFVIFGVIGTLAYDVVTMLIGPLFFAQPLAVAIAGQIPFTLLHLAGAVLFATVLSPIVQKWVVENESLEYALFPAVGMRK